MSELISTALVTGGSRGIGKGVAEALAAQGYQVYLTYVSKPEEAEAVAQNIRQQGRKAHAFGLNGGDSEAVSAFFAEYIMAQVDLAVLVTNAVST